MSSQTECEALIAKYDQANKKLYSSELKELMKLLRTTKIRRSDIVVDVCPRLYNYQLDSENEIYVLKEQELFAALDLGDQDKAEAVLDFMTKKFPSSARVMRLVGILFEFAGKFDDANKLYDKILSTNSANLMVLKRRVCIWKHKGDISKTIEALNTIIRSFPMEISSWVELGELYLSQCEYSLAAHCFEEVVLLEPRNACYHTRLAEVYFTLGDLENVVSSRKHYSLALDLQCAKINPRALYGLILACNRADSLYQENNISSEQFDYKVNEELLKWGKQQLHTIVESQSTNNGVVQLVAQSF